MVQNEDRIAAIGKLGVIEISSIPRHVNCNNEQNMVKKYQRTLDADP